MKVEILLIEYKKQKRIRNFKDPYALCGAEKLQCLEELREIIDNFPAENPDKIDKVEYYKACVLLQAEATRRANQAIEGEKFYNREKLNIVNSALEDFKVQEKLNFMNKYKENMLNKQYTTDMLKEYERLEKREKACCYSVDNDLEIQRKDCDTCAHHSCTRIRT